jgi:glycosyltransferase involved in cell wall biosynthesis
VPTIAVIIPTYNDSDSAVHAVESVLQQTRPADEILIIDDGSRADACPAFASFGDRVRCIRQDNKGLSGARNSGIFTTNCDWVAFLDADDLWMPDKLELQERKLIEHPEFAFVFSDVLVLDEQTNRKYRWLEEKKKAREGWILEALYQEFFILPSTMLFRKNVLDEFSGFDASIRYAGDYDLSLRVALKYQIGCVWEPLVQRRITPGNMSAKTWYRLAEDQLRIWDKIEKTHPVETFPTPDYLRKRKARTHLGLTYNYLALGRPRDARRSLLSSLRLDWNPRLLPRLIALYLFPFSRHKPTGD